MQGDYLPYLCFMLYRHALHFPADHCFLNPAATFATKRDDKPWLYPPAGQVEVVNSADWDEEPSQAE